MAAFDPLRTLALRANMLRMRLSSVTANRHVFDGQVNEKPLRLLLSFDNGRGLRLAVNGDGSGMLVDDLPLDEPIDMEEYGSVVTEDVTGAICPNHQGAEVTDVRVLTLDARQVGVQLLLTGGEAYNFWVEDDELFWGDGAALTAHGWLDGLIPTPGESLEA